MSRIRTVKPELFKHEGLFEAETYTNLPLRLAFVGLLTCCDREGRFRWRPQRLKLDMLPYDNIDITKILDALLNYGFINKYEHQGNWYGCIPSWFKHQQINHREIASDIPAPTELVTVTNNVAEKITTTNSVTDGCPTRDSRVADASQPCPGMPGQNMEYGIGNNVVASVTELQCMDDTTQEIFQHWRSVMKHPDAKLDHKRKSLISKALSFGYSVEQLCHAINGCSMTPHNIGDNERNQRYDGLHIILRDADQIDRFIQNYHNPPQPIREVDKRIQGNIAAVQRWINKKMQEVGSDEQES